MITARIIRLTVERFSGIIDISLKSNKRYLVDCRACYYQLCKVLDFEGKNSLSFIGSLVKRDHATVLHGRKVFKNFYGKESFKANEVYKDSLVYLLDLQGKTNESLELLTAFDLKQHYRIKHIKLTEKSHGVINLLLKKIDLLTKDKFVKKVISLNHQDRIELEERLNIFFKVKKSIQEKQTIN